MVVHDGEMVLFRDMKGKEWLRCVSKEDRLQTHQGIIAFKDIIDQQLFGSICRTTLNRRFMILRPTIWDFMNHIKHRTNVIYDIDATIISGTAGIGSNAKILEAGVGSGSLTLYLSFLVKPTGSIISYDNRKDHIAVAEKNLKKFGLMDGVTLREGDITDVGSVPEKEFFTHAFLDFPEPWNALETVHEALEEGGYLTIFLPSWSQVEKTAKALKDRSFFLLETFEVFKRNFRVNVQINRPSAIHPTTRMIGYTGVIMRVVRMEKNNKVQKDV